MLRISTLVVAGIVSSLVALAAGDNAYIQHNLVADTAGLADATDPGLVNPWGIAESAASPFWISDAGTGLATLYSTSATATVNVIPFKVTVPAGAGAAATVGSPTGQIANPTTVFFVATGKTASFIFSTL